MKKIILFFVVIIGINPCFAQSVPSDCTVPPILSTHYSWDVKNLALRRMYEVNSPDTALIRMPVSWQDTVMNGLAAIFNAVSFPERDTVFNLYCIHENGWNPDFSGQQFILAVDTSYAWTQHWKNLETTTGVPVIDTLTTRYHLKITQYFKSLNMAVLATDSFWNPNALADSFETAAGIKYASPDSFLESSGGITYTKTGNTRSYNFKYGWGDCPAGCIYRRTWKFNVNENCEVQYPGAAGSSGLPPPVNCNTFTGIDEASDAFSLTVFPNPANDHLFVQSGSNEKAEINLYDLSGKHLIRKNFSGSGEIDITFLSPGLYIIEIKKVDRIAQRFKVMKL